MQHFYFLIALAQTIINKYRQVIKNVQESQNYFDDLSKIPTAEQLTCWEMEISQAEAAHTNKPEVMDVMAPKIPKGLVPCSFFHTFT